MQNRYQIGGRQRDKTRLWEDLWLGEIMLKEKNPRLYLVSEHKHMVIEECGLWGGYTWHWNLLWRRELFEWEKGQAHELLELLQQAHLNKDNVDSRKWAFYNTGVFSTKSFTDIVPKNQVGTQNRIGFACRVWCKVAPPKWNCWFGSWCLTNSILKTVW